MSVSKFTASYYIEIFRDIPADEWTTGAFTRGHKCCALGHLGGIKDKSGQVAGLIQLFDRYLGVKVGKVNDGSYPQYYEKTPKQRILARLYTIKAIRQQRKLT